MRPLAGLEREPGDVVVAEGRPGDIDAGLDLVKVVVRPLGGERRVGYEDVVHLLDADGVIGGIFGEDAGRHGAGVVVRVGPDPGRDRPAGERLAAALRDDDAARAVELGGARNGRREGV